MADRGRPRSHQRDADEGFLRRWSRRKSEARSAATAPIEDSSDPAPASAEQTLEPEKGAPATVDPNDLPDIESLDANSDFTAFMRPGVPEHLRTLALRQLWRSDPIFSKLDGLVEYGEDYSLPSWPKGTIKTAYQIGRGFVNELEKLGATEEDQPARPEEPTTGPASKPGPAVASADPRSPADAAAETPQPTSGSTVSDQAPPAAPLEPESSVRRRPRSLPRRR